MSRIFFAILLTCATLFAGYLGSYTARIGPTDHRNSRGMLLRDVGEILRQDRANYYRFGHADPEDTGIGYFRTSGRRARIPRMLRRGWIEPGLVSEIIYGNPLVRVEVYSNHLEIHRLSDNRPFLSPAPTKSYTGPTPLSSTLSDKTAVRRDAQIRLQAHGGPRAFGLELRPTALKHRIALIEPCREGNEIKLFVLAESNALSDRINHCHVCKPALSILTYRKGKNGWAFERAQYGALHHGAWGEGPDKKSAAFLQLSPTHCGLAMHFAYVAQGWYTNSYLLVDQKEGKVRELFGTVLEENSGGSGIKPATNWSTVIRLRPGEREYYDIHLRRHGIKKGERVDYTITYRYDGTEYKPDRPDPLAQ